METTDSLGSMSYMVRNLFLLLAVGHALFAQPKQDHAKNVIVFLADAAGIPTLNAASALGYGAPQKLYVQSWETRRFIRHFDRHGMGDRFRRRHDRHRYRPENQQRRIE